MKSYSVLILGMSFYITFLVVGIPFDVRAGKLYPSGKKLSFNSTSLSLVELVSTAKSYEVTCEEGGRFCVIPSSVEKFRPNVPIPFEPCLFSESEAIAQCVSPALNLTVNTKLWIRGALVGQ